MANGWVVRDIANVCHEISTQQRALIAARSMFQSTIRIYGGKLDEERVAEIDKEFNRMIDVLDDFGDDLEDLIRDAAALIPPKEVRKSQADLS